MKPQGSPTEVLRTFFVLGITSFGGPVAHLGYFRREFVEKRNWLGSEEFAGLLALCQFLPGPASSQVGFCIGLKRAGWLGGLAAWLGFTFPSAVLMLLIAHWAGLFQTTPLARGALHGLELAAIAVVAQAVWLMARSLCPDTPRRVLALLALGVLWLLPNTAGQICVLLLGALTGRLILTPKQHSGDIAARGSPLSHGPALLCLGLALLLLLFAFIAPHNGALALFAAFYRAGALVFGGGHVVLPLLRDAVVVPGWVSPQFFLAGYGAAQAMPGPLFTVASYLGAMNNAGPSGLSGALIATFAIFLPGLLLVTAALPYWQNLQHRPAISAMMMGMNAAVVGLLAAAFITLLTAGTVRSFWDLPVILAALALLTVGRARPLLVVLLCTATGTLLQNA